jgi:ectoine hydroxylase-related dioxygenase (phytanoyl-CoA dioxygenase family)
MDATKHLEEVNRNGFTIIEDVFSTEEITKLVSAIDRATKNIITSGQAKEVFSIRRFLKVVPETIPVIFNAKLKALIKNLWGTDYFLAKAIYFDKPQTSNWFVAYHQDLTISVDKKQTLEGYGPWTVKQHQFAVQPPLEILENMFALRLHLDDTNQDNGALKIIRGSHLKGIRKHKDIDWLTEEENTCPVAMGSIMVMKPLLFHSSGRTLNNKRRRVIHLEFSNCELPPDISWAERINWTT